ncbi:ATP-binding cassette domain-containing protein [Herbiconiux daphne]|uniref:ATP-binding cassette domain-containing protein n=1 Tax=Herbiconiux daphne TaxID=2970914 RepID=A0ABT2H8I1_9MICO|nr:ATP-binding cassette domain-containing protein [Herbiconiux daphne]MCS5736275.1 ATP-binding cassette domain-containing protein [Herbiconiux daphne]
MSVSGGEMRFALASGDEVVARRGAVIALCGENGSGLDAVVAAVTAGVRAHAGAGAVGVSGAAAAGGLVGTASGGDAGLVGAGPGNPSTYALIDRRRGLAPTLDVAENIYLGMERKSRLGPFSLGIDWKRTRADAAADLLAVGSQVSVTEVARALSEIDRLLVELARAVARNAELVLLDEPTADLTDAESERLFAVLRDFADRGVAVLVLTQKPRQAMGYADEIVVVRDGEVAGRHESASWNGSAAAAASVHDRVLDELVDRPPRRIYPVRASVPDPSRELLRIAGWTARDPIDRTSLLVDDASLVVAAGEVVGIAGLQRSNAEAFLLSVYGRSAGTDAAGTVLIEGSPVDTSTVEKAIASGLFYAGTDTPRYRVRFVGGVAMPVSASRLSTLAAAGLVDRNSDLRPSEGWGSKVLGAVRSVSREGDAGARIRGLVKEFAASERLVLMLGEPTAGATDAERTEFYAGLEGITAAGKGVVIVSTDLDELLGVCDRVVTMAQGRVTGTVPRGTPPAAVAALIAPL